MYRRYIQRNKSITFKVDDYFSSKGLQKDDVNVLSKYVTRKDILKR